MRRHVIPTLVLAAAVMVAVSGWDGASALALRWKHNAACCQLSPVRNLKVTLGEAAGLVEYPSELGQDKWVLEHVFPGVTDGFFVDVGSGHGHIGSNSLALEQRGWTGLCIDPFPVHMEQRTCRVLQDVVYGASGRELAFHKAGGLGGVGQTLAPWNVTAARAPVVRLRTTTLGDVLDRTQAPTHIHFISIDIEGAELEALRGFPFDRYRVGAWAIEHNREEPKRSDIIGLLKRHGYDRVHSWRQDDYFRPSPQPATSDRGQTWVRRGT